MRSLTAVEIKAFVPARDFDLSKRFYTELGFTIASSSDDIAYIRYENCSFLLQRFFIKEHAENFLMHFLVQSADAWHEKVQVLRLDEKYGVHIGDLCDQPWAMWNFTLSDPTGVVWRIGHNLPPAS